MSGTGTEKKRPLWDWVLALLEEDLAERRARKFVVEVRSEAGPHEKEIGELSPAEIRNLEPGLRRRVGELLLDRYLAEQGRVDLREGKRAYTKSIRELALADLLAVIEADRQTAEERREEHKREEFVREVQEDLDYLLVAEVLRRTTKTPASPPRLLSGARRTSRTPGIPESRKG